MLKNECFNVLVAFDSIKEREKRSAVERKTQFAAEARIDDALQEMNVYLIEHELDKLWEVLDQVTDKFQLSEAREDTLRKEILESLERLINYEVDFTHPISLEERTKRILDRIRLIKETLTNYNFNEVTRINPVGCCPKCKTLWYDHKQFCHKCGLKRID